uniref:Uncharacterized protein n=1 Tax=Fagus sylvatica TaxID=28930 RepID=A0A2N9H8H9_FAGSY
MVHHLIPIKLTRDNYLLWKAQTVPYLRSQHLYGFLDGSQPTSPQVLTSSTNVVAQILPNPNFQSWHLQDQMILSAFNLISFRNRFGSSLSSKVNLPATIMVVTVTFTLANLGVVLHLNPSNPIIDMDMAVVNIPSINIT